MAWTAPMTAVANTAFTAAQFNTNVRDNFLETAPAKATTAGGYFVATGTNAISQRLPASNIVLTSQTTASATFTTLATLGPSVTVTTGTKALVHIAARIWNNTSNSASLASFEVTGATTIAASDNVAVLVDGVPSGGSNGNRQGVSTLVTTLNAGTNTFTMKYRANSGTASFSYRELIVLPL